MDSKQISSALVIGVISDTHGPLTQEAAGALFGTDHILVAGDIVSDKVIPVLEKIAPVTAIRGNMDSCGEPSNLPKTALEEIGGIWVYLIHDLGSIELDPSAADIRMVVHGHTHRPSIEIKNNVLYLNPGSAAFPRGPMFSSIARVTLSEGRIFPEIVNLRPVKDCLF